MMKKEKTIPKVNVIITTYNNAHTLPYCLESALTQTFQDYKILVVDNGSTDNTTEVVSKYSVGYFRQENKGLTAGLNKGIELTQGQYIAFLDSDDILVANALEKRVEVLDKHPEVGFCYGQIHLMDESGNIYGLRKSTFLNESAIVDGKEQIKELLFTNRITLSTVMVRRRCFDESVGKLDERFKYFGDDLLMFIKLAKAYPVAYISEPLAKYRRRSGFGRIYVKDAERAWFLALQEVFDTPELQAYFRPWREKAYFNAYKSAAGYVYGYGRDIKLTRHYLRKAIKIYPRSLLQREALPAAYLYARALIPNRLSLMLRNLKARFRGSSRNNSRERENA